MARKNKHSDPRGRGRKQDNELELQEPNRALSKRERRNAARRNEPVDDEYDYIEDDVGVTKASMKKAMRYVIISFVFLLLSIGIFFGSIFMHNTSITNQRNSCWRHQQEVQELMTKYMGDHGFASLPAYVEDIEGFESTGKIDPNTHKDNSCTRGGEYTWDPVNGKYTCSVHGDVPDGFGQAESVKTGRTTTITNKNSS